MAPDDDEPNMDVPMEPLIEMSQDCVVEWRESHNDLQDNSKSPNLSATPSSSTISSRGWSGTRGLDDIRRNLGKSPTEKFQTQPPNSAERRDRAEAPSAEEEIDAIYSILQQDGDQSRTDAQIPTQQLGNKTSLRATLPPRRPTATSLALRHRRRRRQLEDNPQSNKRQHIDKAAMPRRLVQRRQQQPTPTTPPKKATAEEGSSEGAFDGLLEQMSTPTSDHARPHPSRKENCPNNSTLVAKQTAVPPKTIPPKRAPLAPQTVTPQDQITMPKVDRPVAAPTKSTGPSSTSQHPKEQENRQGGLAPVVPAIQNQVSGPSTGNAMLAASRHQTLPTRNPTAVSNHQSMPPPQPKIPTVKPTEPKQDADYLVDMDMSGIDMSDVDSLLPKSAPATDPMEMGHSLTSSSIPSSNQNKPSQTLARNATTVESSSTTNDGADEFGDLDLSGIDMANLDSLLSCASSQQVAPLQATNSTTQANTQPRSANSLDQSRRRTPQIGANLPNGNEESRTAPVIPSVATKPEAVPPRVLQPIVPTQTKDTVQPPSKGQTVPVVPKGQETSQSQAVVDDEFGEFPDFDFELIDHAIEQRQQSQQQLPAALLQSIIKNPRSLATGSPDLSFIKFSRYKVLEVTEDNQEYTKTLSVASWTESMAKGNDLKNIHKNCSVEVVHSAAKDAQAANPTDLASTHTSAGFMQLRGQWYHTMIEPGDIVHLCSLSGSFRTDASALPIVLHSHPPEGSFKDDLVLITHPDMLVTPTTVSETVSCPRRAVLKSRIGSTGLSSTAALIGTMRHSLFEVCIREKNFEPKFVKRTVQKIVLENSEALLGCGVTSVEAESQVLTTLPIIQKFVDNHTAFGPNSSAGSAPPRALVNGHITNQGNVFYTAHSTFSVEEPIISPELALKGNVDAVLETTTEPVRDENHSANRSITGLSHSLMALELKTGHNQTTQAAHMAQLSLYTLMLQVRYGQNLNIQSPLYQLSSGDGKPDPDGAAAGGLLLYLNHESTASVHVAPELHEIKSLIGQRNAVSSELVKAAKPRGIVLSYEKETGEKEEKQGKKVKLLPAPPTLLPEVKSGSHSCQRCFANRECMLYATAEIDHDDRTGIQRSHAELLSRFVGHLSSDDIVYFREWDRLIDLEADACNNSVATAWLAGSEKREKATGETAGSLVYAGATPGASGSGVVVRFRRSDTHSSQQSLDALAFSKGCQVIVSTDGSSFDDSSSNPSIEYQNTQRQRKKFRHHMHLVKGFLENIEKDEVRISTRREDLERIRDMTNRYKKLSYDNGDSELLFRLDRDNSSVGIGTLRQNLINLFTLDNNSKSNEQLSQLDKAMQNRLPKLRDFIVRLKPPSFHSIDTHAFFRGPGPRVPGCDLQVLAQEFESLNRDQQDAVGKVLNARDYSLIQGLPGTGKTSTLSFIARLLAARGKRVLITSYTHAAVDNVALKLIEKGVSSPDPETGLSSLVRIGQQSSCHEQTRCLLAHELAIHLESEMASSQGISSNENTLSQSSLSQLQLPSAQSLSMVVTSAAIVCCSALAVPRSPLLSQARFDVVIVDEAGQISQPAILGALMAADSFVLVGDHKQLPPLVNSEIAEAGGYGESMLMRLAEKHPSCIAPLTHQYRMNEVICRLSSEAVYGGRLKCGNDQVRGRRLPLTQYPAGLPRPAGKGVFAWLKGVVDPEKPVIFVDTDNVKKNPRPPHERSNASNDMDIEALEEKMGGRAVGSVTNPMEATFVRYIVQGLLSSGVPASSIAVISPFRAQLRVLDDDNLLASAKSKGLEVSTIDRYQGRDKPIIILSFVRSNVGGHAGRLLQDKRRLNVAFTRAQSKLIMVGSFSTLKRGSDPLRPLLCRIEKRGQRFLLPENAAECYRIT